MLTSLGKLEDIKARRQWLLVMKAALDAYKHTGNSEFMGIVEICGEVSAMIKNDIETRDYCKRDAFLEKFNSIMKRK